MVVKGSFSLTGKTLFFQSSVMGSSPVMGMGGVVQ
jgi:hypothetical protein